MFRFSIPSLVKFLVGILLLQAITVLLVYTAQQTNLEETWWLFASLGGAIGILVALWFTSLAEGHRRKAESHLKDRHYREREAFRTKLEKEKAQAVRTTERQITKARSRASSGTMLKGGAVVGGVVGVMLLMTQFVTIGLLTLTAAGGLLLGYGARTRQERWTRNKLVGSQEKPVEAITVSAKPSIAGPTRGRRTKERDAEINEGQA
ncbi:hypothetical protein ABC977_12760 [Thioalkalicoccus limnaeus]|uniref:Uncharacterized protein n=1 Tax=Thioalkalicoccus limnaeus TaxID=120681 RepID=A0ABV4BIZ0_9GAMM